MQSNAPYSVSGAKICLAAGVHATSLHFLALPAPCNGCARTETQEKETRSGTHPPDLAIDARPSRSDRHRIRPTFVSGIAPLREGSVVPAGPRCFEGSRSPESRRSHRQAK